MTAARWPAVSTCARSAVSAAWTPAWLLAGSVALIAAPIAHYPVRLALNVLPFVVLFGAAWWALRRGASRSTTTVALGFLGLLCVAPAYADRRDFPQPVRARPESAVLWSTTLQHPDQAIRRYVRLPAEHAGERPDFTYRLRVQLAEDYRGAAALVATINDVALGPLRPVTWGDGRVGYDEWGLPVPWSVLALRPVTEIVIRQTAPDPTLRIVAYAQWAGATMGEDASWFFDGAEWHRGVLQPLSGRVVPGLPHVWLAPDLYLRQ